MKNTKISAAEKAKDAKKTAAKTAPKSPEKFHFNLKKIMIPVDFSEHSMKALHYAKAFAKQYKAKLLVVHVVEQMVYPGDWMYPPITVTEWAGEKRHEVLKKLGHFTKKAGIEAELMVRLGRAWQEIIEAAKEQECDLLITSTHGYTGLKHALLGSVAEKVIRHAPCPVLTVHAHERDFV